MSRLLVALSLSVLVLPACKRRQTDNPDVAADYKDNQYQDDVVTARMRNDYENQGKGIDPKTLTQIEDTIQTVYQRDIERCLEDQMSEHNTRFLRSVFVVEFHIDTSGQAGDAKILEIAMRKQNAKGSDLGEVPADGLKSCIQAAIGEWEFEPAPEVEYVHTYRGQVGEAF
jgi:hypothetical protein